ncbi:head GIN domain-containing protein [Nocardia seriolae]|nr:head GIN domain-containing protein [Nocardia seriolae]QOW32433.1 DUF2807 domain-containing protein [Nocardia seriolae]QUN20042.1 DUF2807 domain-containing protein [Nocardia seriolae]WKY52432.1 head GIN domain-containing protein [Nocardia seriolae]WNJ59527.1 head GIN domain-containing protein [Nocardia seriolae]BEK84298.1 hypothetical protein NSERKGN1266_02490 [Nocardia seriolae]
MIENPRRILAAVLCALAFAAGCSGPAERAANPSSSAAETGSPVSRSSSPATGSSSPAPGNLETTKDFSVATFTAVDLDGPYNLVVNVGTPTSVRAEGDPAGLDVLDIRVSEDTLVASVKPGARWPAGAHVTVTAVVSALTAVKLAGPGGIHVGAVAADTLVFAENGSGTIEAPQLTVSRLTASLSGSGIIRAGGTSEDVDLSLDGSGPQDLSALTTKRAAVALAGSGSLTFRATEKVTGSLAGADNVTVVGDAKCSVSRAGSGRVTCN